MTKSMFVPKGNNAVKVYEQKNAIQKDATLGEYYITRDYFESKMTGFEVFPGDVIVSCAGTIGETYILPDGIEQGIINQALMRMQIFEPMFLPYFAPELDAALVSEPLEWLKEYPVAHRTYITALKQYAEGIYIRDVADNLRKTLEAFLQEFLGNNKNLETNKNDICKYLGEQGIDAGISGLFQPLINAYKNINDRIAKHNDAVDEKLLEFLLYQTGVLVRMVLTVKHSDAEIANSSN